MKNTHVVLSATLAAPSVAAGVSAGAAYSDTRLAVPAHESVESASSVESAVIKSQGQTAAPSVRVRRVVAGDLEGRNLKLMYKEDFSLFTEGSEEEPQLLYSGWIEIPGELTAQPGWTGNGMYEAGGVLGLCNPGHDGYQGGGCINSPLGNYAGKIIVKFRIKPRQADGVMFVTICRGGVEYPSMASKDMEVLNFKTQSDWTDVAYEIEDPYSDADGFVQINTVTFNGDGFLIDDIEIYRDMDFVTAPSTVDTGAFTTDGFTAVWGEIPAADDYLLTVQEETQLGTDDVTGLADFNGIQAGGEFNAADCPEGWEISLTGHTQTSATLGNGGTPCIVLSDANDYITLPLTGGPYKTLSFFTRPIGDNAANELGYLDIDVLDPTSGEWKRYAFMNAGVSNKETGYVVDLNAIEAEYPAAYPFKDLYTRVRIRLDRTSETSALAVDDIRFTTNPPRERKSVVEDLAVDGTSYTLTGLDPEKEHYVSVKSRSAAGVSDPSSFFHAFGIADVEDLKAVDMDRRGGVTAQWPPVPRASYYVVASYDVETVKEDTPEARILEDDFSKVTVRNPVDDPLFLGNENSTISLDEYTQQPGWTGRGNIVAKGMLGCIDDPYAMFEINSPEITLSNNNGDYEVRLKVYSEAGAQFVVQGTGVYKAATFPETGLYEMVVELPEGQDHDRLMFYTVEGQMFLIDEIEVVQDLKKGDRLYSLLDKVQTPDSSYRFSIAPEEGKLYGLQVQAYQNIYNKTCASGLSPIAIVDFFNVGVGNVNAGNASFGVETGTGSLSVCAGENGVNVYDVSGRIVARVAASADITMALAPGIYVVSDGVSTVKTLVK